MIVDCLVSQSYYNLLQFECKSTALSINTFFDRYATWHSRNLPCHTSWKTSHDVLCYTVEGNSSCLQEVHARCNYKLWPVGWWQLQRHLLLMIFLWPLYLPSLLLITSFKFVPVRAASEENPFSVLLHEYKTFITINLFSWTVSIFWCCLNFLFISTLQHAILDIQIFRLAFFTILWSICYEMLLIHLIRYAHFVELKCKIPKFQSWMSVTTCKSSGWTWLAHMQ